MRLEKLTLLLWLLGFLLSCDSNDSRRPSIVQLPAIDHITSIKLQRIFVNMADGAERHQIEGQIMN